MRNRLSNRSSGGLNDGNEISGVKHTTFTEELYKVVESCGINLAGGNESRFSLNTNSTATASTSILSKNSSTLTSITTSSKDSQDINLTTTKKKNSIMVETNMIRLKQDMELLLKTLKQVVGNSPLCFVLLNLDSWGTERKELNEIREFLVKFNQQMNDDCRWRCI